MNARWWIRITLPSLLLGFGALASSTSAAAAGPSAETVITNNEVRHWFAFRPARDDFQETILDCSRWVEAPTGRHGFVTAKGDRFVFEDGTPIRFWGAQMNLWSKEQTDYVVHRMRRQGINITRLHGLNSLGNDARSFEPLDYLLSKLGENGIYLANRCLVCP